MAGGSPFLDGLFVGFSYLQVASAPVTFSKTLNLSSNFTATYNTATNAIDIRISASAPLSVTGLELGYFRIYESTGDTAMVATGSIGIVSPTAVGLNGGGASLTLAAAGAQIDGANLGLWGGSYGGGGHVIFIGNASVVPGSNPTGGSVMYAEAGALKARGSGGTVTTFAPAEPHCPRCGNDYVLEWENAAKGHHLAICFTCLTSSLEAAGVKAEEYAFAYQVGGPR